MGQGNYCVVQATSVTTMESKVPTGPPSDDDDGQHYANVYAFSLYDSNDVNDFFKVLGSITKCTPDNPCDACKEARSKIEDDVATKPSTTTPQPPIGTDAPPRLIERAEAAAEVLASLPANKRMLSYWKYLNGEGPTALAFNIGVINKMLENQRKVLEYLMEQHLKAKCPDV